MAQTVQLVPSFDEQFEEHRRLLRAVAFRLLGSIAASDAAIGTAWERLDPEQREATDVRSRLVSATAAMSLDVLRTRETFAWHVPDVFVSDLDERSPDELAFLGGSVGVAPYVALDDLTPEQRTAFVLHDDFDVPLGEISTILGCSTTETERLVGEGRVLFSACPVPDADVASQHKVVNTYMRATKRRDLDTAMGLLHEDIRMRSDAGEHALSAIVSSDPETVARRAIMLGRVPSRVVPVLVNGAAGVVMVGLNVLSVLAMTVVDGRIAQINTLHGPERIAALNLPSLA